MLLALVDVDGVLADLVPHLLSRVEADLLPVEATRYDFLSLLPPNQAAHALRLLGTAEFWRTLPVVEGAKEGLARLRARGYEVIFTSRPWADCRGWAEARQEWIEKRFGQPAELMIGARKEILRGDLFIDDCLDNVVLWAKKNPDSQFLVFAQPWNSTWTNSRLRGWANLARHLPCEQKEASGG